VKKKRNKQMWLWRIVELFVAALPMIAFIAATLTCIILVVLVIIKPGRFGIIKEKFGNGIYDNWEKQLQSLAQTHQIGVPGGLLSVFPNQQGSFCGKNFMNGTNQNLVVQPNVAFQSDRQGNGCTYVDLRWPGA
jgi:hypothetical protein